MQKYQERYIENTKAIVVLRKPEPAGEASFSAWFAAQRKKQEEIERLKAENLSLLENELFPVLDNLYGADDTLIRELEAFADELMDWRTNLDCGIYILIHDALLSLYRYRKDRDGIIRELYRLGMGLYYQNRSIQGIRDERTVHFYFENEMVFTEGGSYLKFFDRIDDEETKGYIIRSLANIAICAKDMHRRIAVSARILEIVKDPYYRELAPNLPWDVFLRRTEQQMSSNRNVLSAGDLSKEELAAVFEACAAVFEPEKEAETPNIRWLWPYYEMEYSCGFADLKTTLERMEQLIESVPAENYDVSGLYANVQLPIYYGRLLKANPQMPEKPRRLKFLQSAYAKMMRTMLTFPADQTDDFFAYNLILVLTDYYETEGVPSYAGLALQLMRRYAEQLYLQSMQTGQLMEVLAEAAYDRYPDFFDDVDFLKEEEDPDEKRRKIKNYAGECGLFLDFGLIKMNFERLQQTRNLLEYEFLLYRLHTLSGYDDLAARPSAGRYADVALGHHSWYNGAGGYPSEYVRNDSPYRQMTDVAALAVYLMENRKKDMAELLSDILEQEGRRFSPMLTALAAETGTWEKLTAILEDDNRENCRKLYEEMRLQADC